jgi:hypothetical protein
MSIINDDSNDLRAKTNKCYKCSLTIVRSKAFSPLISICILLNTIVLALDRHPITKNELKAIEYSNLFFYFVFLVEMVFIMLGLSF